MEARSPASWSCSARAGFLAIFFALVLACSGPALLVRGVINAKAAFRMRVAVAIRSRKTADTVTRIAPPARKIGGIFILVAWAAWTLGLAIAVPAMMRDMSS